MELNKLRSEIDEIDRQIVSLFSKRMDVCAEIGKYKKENDLPVFDAQRELEKIRQVVSLAPEQYADYTERLYKLLFELSRTHQKKLLYSATDFIKKIEKTLQSTQKEFPNQATVACPGAAGAYSQLACDKLFSHASIFYFPTFESVFSAVESGLCRYGVIPVENSTAGSVNRVYDLMMQHRFSIVRSCRMKIDHQLSAISGTSLEDIREIYSHEQAIEQCSDFLQKLKNVTVHRCENTAVAAKLVADQNRHDIAALCSRSCTALYGLQAVRSSVQNQQNNYTRFICITKQPEIYPGADRTSLMMVLEHKPGSLYRVLSQFSALGIDLLKLESRPIPERDFEFAFYFDINVSVYSPKFLQLLSDLEDCCEKLYYLGSYNEVI